MTRAEIKELEKQAREKGCTHGFGLGNHACPPCVEERVAAAIRKANKKKIHA